MESAWGTADQALRCLISRSWGIPALEWYTHNKSHFVNVDYIHIQEPHSWHDCTSQLCLNMNYRHGNTLQWKLHLTHEYLNHVSVSDSPGCWSVLCPMWYDIPAKAAALARIHKPVGWILTHVLNIARQTVIDNWHWQICCSWFVIRISAQDSPM